MNQYCKLSSNLHFLRQLNQKQIFNVTTPPHFNLKFKEQDYIVNGEIDVQKYALPHTLWTKDQVKKCELENRKGKKLGDKFAFKFAKIFTKNIDILCGYQRIFPWQSKEINEKIWLNRLIYIENATGIPGFVGAMWRHLSSLRNMKTQETGWIHSLLKESENERIHLLIFLKTYRPGFIYRTGLLLSHFWYVFLFANMYLIAPRITHRIVGHIEEEAIINYTKLLDEIQKENSPVSHWKNKKAHKLARDYWNLDENATLEDIILYVRKDKQQHIQVNHDLADDYKYKGYPDPKSNKVY
ncbi:hypothetical protein PPERSA_00014 [Pseudocohnilembus persalinus]|uniref:Alternative oxidase n=1 Tax=Pseudocohnilembus persalinus TaxID=266149 RepID=A0A0V0QVB7_PSEPJ|nr:hypothetical protein PPERSA_00014 [Pseudocohnilembus persalinus]|eukprot:KRX06134.1 hypothetical protein PPERSA_00014 [Pseudocohnilembus persalinus]